MRCRFPILLVGSILSTTSLASAAVVVESAEPSLRARSVGAELAAFGFDVRGPERATASDCWVHVTMEGRIDVYVRGSLRASLDGNDDPTVARRVAESVPASACKTTESPIALPSSELAVDKPRSAETPSSKRRHVIDLSPLDLVYGRFSAGYEGFVAKHHALTFGAGASTQLAVGTAVGFDTSFGYHFYNGEHEAEGFFVGPSLIVSGYRTRDQYMDSSGPEKWGSALGGAFDFGWSFLLGEHVRFAVGFGLQDVAYVPKRTAAPDDVLVGRRFDTGIRPRLLLSFGWRL